MNKQTRTPEVLVDGRLELLHAEALLKPHHVHVVAVRDPRVEVPDALEGVVCGGVWKDE